ncbi:RNA polymerase sigma-70 factor, ECF subfamily [Solimonas aquatica]|uniref:RNA polymerase sigma-70 factor, ECF subfamily n=1 Tax=Solimonas aquatica TaxID=489703 RepID=A0A1H9M6N6_9GAMM|nr:RNA polymerase sigma factor [Solimonas aquatica]SER19348.1 RNA polymerase sigma-70 factor, ECF subfamily [Solimonas aquatica]
MSPAQARAAVDAAYREHSRAVLATLIRQFGDFDRAEEALHEAFRAALEQWPQAGLPDHPRAWLIAAGRFKGIDGLRRESRFEPLDLDVHDRAAEREIEADHEGLEDDRLRLIFTCCHPALGFDAQVALTLREVCGLSTEEIARAFLTPATTLAQRIVRAKAKIRDARIPYEVPAPGELAERLDSVLRAIYLVFNEGYAASAGAALTRHELCDEAVRLARLLVQLLPEPEAMGLLALMLLHDARRATRSTPDGELVLLEHQDRSAWDQTQIAQGAQLVRRALLALARLRPPGPYLIQAAIAAVHAQAPDYAQTDWAEIVGLYELLLRAQPSPIVALNHAVALAMRDGAQAGLDALDALLAQGELDDYHLAHAARADLCRRLGRTAEAHGAYQRALALSRQEPEQRFLRRRLAELEAG